ncbi:MAG: DUF4383 domain-containing protein [Waterburya sp.]
MNQSQFSFTIGIVFVSLGVLGFAPSLLSLPPVGFESNIPLDPSIFPYAQGFGYLFGLFATNLMHNLVHLTVGLFGIAASGNFYTARSFNRLFAVSYILIAIMGLLPFSKTLFGFMPIFGNNVWFNALTGLFAGYFGFIKPETPQVLVSER